MSPRRLVYLTPEVVEELAQEIAQDLYGPTGFVLLGSTGQAALESAVYCIRLKEYRTIFIQAAALFRSLIVNHPWLDGNKRLGTCATFLVANGRTLLMPDPALTQLALSVAEGVSRVRLGTLARILKRFSIEPEMATSAIDVVVADSLATALAWGMTVESAAEEINDKLAILDRYALRLQAESS